MRGRYVIYSSHLEDSGFRVDADAYASRLQAACNLRGWDVSVEVRRDVSGVGSGWSPLSLEDADADVGRDALREAEDMRQLADSLLMGTPLDASPRPRHHANMRTILAATLAFSLTTLAACSSDPGVTFCDTAAQCHRSDPAVCQAALISWPERQVAALDDCAVEVGCDKLLQCVGAVGTWEQCHSLMARAFASSSWFCQH